jgi:HTH-type transcriptional regulator/antitoxin HigA
MIGATGKKTARATPDAAKYSQLLADVGPMMPRTVKDNQRLLQVVRRLIDKDESRTPEETALVEVLIALIHRFEQEHYKPERSKPHEVVAYLLEEHDLRQRDLLDIFPTRSRVSEVLSGKRAITKEQAVLLAKRFGVEPSLFIELP